MKLNFLCGRRVLEGYVNLDGQALPGVDTVFQVDPFYPRLPFGDGSVEEIYANNAVEHIANTNALIQEFWRISRDGATWYILVPGWLDRNSYVDPTHYSHWTKDTLQFYTKEGFDSRRYEPALISYEVRGEETGGLEFSVTAIKKGLT